MPVLNPLLVCKEMISNNAVNGSYPYNVITIHPNIRNIKNIAMYADASLISLSLIFFPPILVLTTLPSGETKLVTVKFIPFITVKILISFKPPLVDPEEPPISIKTINIMSEEPLQVASS